MFPSNFLVLFLSFLQQQHQQIPIASDAKRVFGIDLSLSFDPANSYDAPLIVTLLTSEIERQAKLQPNLDLYKLYRTKIPLEQLIELRDVLNTTHDQLQSVLLSKYEIQYLVSLLLRYLRELPNPVIPVKFYEQFISCLKQSPDKQTVTHLMHLINTELPEHHRLTLSWIMGHLCRVCCLQYERGNREHPLPLVQVFCHIFLRPMWDDIVKIVYNTPEHIRIMELLLLNGDWGEKLPEFITAPALPPRKSSRIGVIKPSAIVPPQQHSSSSLMFDALPAKPHQQNPMKIDEELCSVTMMNPSSVNNVINQKAMMRPPPLSIIPALQQSVVQSSSIPEINRPAMAPPPSAAVAATNNHPPESNILAEAEWYWGNISRDEVKEKLMDARDGTFLVRDATSGHGNNTHKKRIHIFLTFKNFLYFLTGEYTLTLKKDGTDRVIKIYNSSGRYGFVKEGEKDTFLSVVELINYYRNVTLKEYNSLLDIKLMYPVSRYSYDEEYRSLMENKDALVQKFVEVTGEIKTLSIVLEQLHDNYKRTETDIGFKRQAHEAFQEAETMFSDQILIQQYYRKEAQPHEQKKLDENKELLQQRLNALKDCKRNLESDLDQQRRHYQKLELDINKIKLEINALLRQEKRLKSMMSTNNICDQLIRQIMDEGTIAWDNQNTVNHLYDESSWHLPNFSRSEAERNLQSLPTGTFLIRNRAGNRDYALSIVANGTVNHCIIYQTEHGTFGFAEPYNIYKSLKELVLHYSTNSLEEHNESLQTTLKYPFLTCTRQTSSSSSTLSSFSSSNSSTAVNSTT